MGPDYFSVRVHSIPSEIEEIISGFLFDQGALGSSEVLSWTQPELEYAPLTIDSSQKSLEFYFYKLPEGDWESRLRSLVENSEPSSDIKIEILNEKSKDWLEEWKKGFSSFHFVNDFWVVPSWEKVEPSERVNIFVDPGMAFGTGTHESTQLAGRLLADGSVSGLKVLDVGTGTGILAILAHKLGASEVHAMDNDVEALRVSRENFGINKCSSIQIGGESLQPYGNQTFDLVVVNIIEGILIELNPELIRVLKPGGRIVFAGLLASQRESFTSSFALPSGFQWGNSIENGEWLGIEAKA